MTQYIDKDAVVAEIERLIERAKAERVLYPKTILSAKNFLLLEDYDRLKKIIDKIEAKETDLEEEMDKEWNKCEPIDEGMGLEIASIEHEQFDNIAKHFFELGLKVQKEDNMTQEEKNILIKELCMRIPYGVKCNINGKLCKVTRVDVECQQVYLKKDDGHGGTYSIARGDIIKPYLRPMSSMTDEEAKEFDNISESITIVNHRQITPSHYDYMIEIADMKKVSDWFAKKHFDTAGLIPMGLALEAPEGMYIN